MTPIISCTSIIHLLNHSLLRYKFHNSSFIWTLYPRSGDLFPQLLSMLVKILPPQHDFPKHRLQCLSASKIDDDSTMLTTPISLLQPQGST